MNDLKHALLSDQVVLYYLDWTAPFQVHVDASKIHLHPVRFASCAFTLPEDHWRTTHQELYAMKWALEQFHPYILGSFTKVTDHANLKWLTTISPKQ